MAWSKLDILNLALNKLNKGSVNAISDSGEFADAADRAFEMLYASEIAGFAWRFATKVQQLSVLIPPPILTQWSYQLQLPADYLAAVRVVPRITFQIYEDKIFANTRDLQLEYRFLPDPTHLPAYFVRFFSIELASWFADAVANDDRLAQKLQQEAFDARSQGLFIDSQSHPTTPMISQPLIDCRGGGNFGWGV